MKIYKAQVQMVTEMNSRLRNHGIPFFGTKRELIRMASAASVSQATKPDDVIEEVELIELQRRMVALLEDMCND